MSFSVVDCKESGKTIFEVNMPSRAPLSPQQIAQLHAGRAETPVYLFAKQLGLSEQTMMRALAGLCLYRATRTYLEMKLKDFATGQTNEGLAV